MKGTIGGLYFYPVKACSGASLTSATLLERGIKHDRRWMIVDRHGRFVTQRELPALTRVRPELRADRLRLALPDGAVADLPVDDGGEPVTVLVWRDTVEAVAPSPEADWALSACLGRALRIVRFPEVATRPCDPAYAPEGSHTAFADGFPLLIVSEGSLDALNAAIMERGGEPVPMERFRPNVVLTGLPPWAEDEARVVRPAAGGGAPLLLAKPCERCVVTTTDQVTGERMGPEPIATLRRLRAGGRIVFGQNAVPALADGGTLRLAVGDAVALGA